MKSFILIFCFITTLFSYESVEVLSDHVKVHKSGFFKTQENLEPTKVKEIFENDRYTTFGLQAYCDGCNRSTYWYGFDIEIQNSPVPIYLDLLDTNLESCHYSIFDNSGELIGEANGGMLVPIHEREFQSFGSRFLVSSSENFKGTALIECNSYYSKFLSFGIGETNKLDTIWDWRHGVFLLTSGIFIGLFFYNLILLITTKDSIYFYYLLYNTSIYLQSAIFLGYIVYFPSLAQNSPLVLALVSNILYISLVIFTQKFLDLKRKFPRLNRVFKILLILLVISSIGFPLGLEFTQYISEVILGIITLLIFFMVLKLLIKSSIEARFYLLAVGINIIAQIVFFIHMGDQRVIPFSLWSINILSFALALDMILLSLALAYRIKMITEQKQQLEQLAILKSRYQSFGQVSGNIIHQWRTPLGQLGALLGNLKTKVQYSQVDSKEILRVVDSSNNIIQYLSQTISTFQHLFQNSISKDSFSINDEINECLKFLEPSLKELHISIKKTLCEDILIQGDKKDFFHALMILLTNAKDALEKKETSRLITIETKIDKGTFNLFIQDNAGGISDDDMKFIFTQNYSTKDEGLGLGLYIAKTLIEQKLNGDISVENKNGGANFILSFQLK